MSPRPRDVRPDEWKVTFGQPVLSGAGTLRQKWITELLVNAPSAEAAKTHALRVTTGDPGVLQVEPTSVWELQNDLLWAARGVPPTYTDPPVPGRIEPPAHPALQADGDHQQTQHP